MSLIGQEVYKNSITELNPSDDAAPETFNPILQDLINNDAYMKERLEELISGAPGALDTLNKLANALGNDENFATTVLNVLDTKLNSEDFNQHQADYIRQPGYAVAAGADNAYAISLYPVPSAYVDGMAVTVKINVDNTGSATININGLGAVSIKKANGNDVSSGNLKAGSIYSFRYNGLNFILQGEGGGGDAFAADLLSGKKASVDVGDIIGTMPIRTGDNVAVSNSVSGSTLKLVVPQGYYNGVDSKVCAIEPNFKAENIADGISIFGIGGTYKRIYTNATLYGTSPRLLQRYTTESYMGFYRTPSEDIQNGFTITGLKRGFYYFATNVSPYSFYPYYSGSYGTGGSGLRICSIATGQYYTISVGYNVGYRCTYRTIMAEMVGLTTLRVTVQVTQLSNDPMIHTQMAEITVSANFFASGVYLQDYIGIAYSPIYNYEYNMQTTLDGVLYKF